jgi:hypothetical protein
MALLYSRQSTFDCDPEKWAAGKTKTIDVIRASIKNSKLITYKELYEQIKAAIQFPRHHQDQRFHFMLGQISEDEDDAGRGMMTAVVVGKSDWRPGTGWYKLAERRGRNTKFADRCWAEELMQLAKVWSADRR